MTRKIIVIAQCLTLLFLTANFSLAADTKKETSAKKKETPKKEACTKCAKKKETAKKDACTKCAKKEEAKPDLCPKVPKDGIVLLDDKKCEFVLMDGSEPIDWPLEKGILTSSGGKRRHHSNHIVSKYHFRDAKIHVEFLLPKETAGNSGIYIHGGYEMQILASNDVKDADLKQTHCGALYGFGEPLTNALLARDKWQTYDIWYTAPRWDKEGKVTTPGKVTAYLNGKLVQKDTEINDPRSGYRPWKYKTTDWLGKIHKNWKATSVAPVFLQDHGNPVKFRNVWLQPLDKEGFYYKEK